MFDGLLLMFYGRTGRFVAMCRVSGLWSGLPGCRLSSQCGQWCALTALPPRHLTTELVSGWCTDLVWTADGSAVTPACRLPYLLVLVNRLRLDVGDVSGCELIRLSGFCSSPVLPRCSSH